MITGFHRSPGIAARLATLLAEEVHISDVDPALQRDAVARGMKIIPSQLTAIGHE